MAGKHVRLSSVIYKTAGKVIRLKAVRLCFITTIIRLCDYTTIRLSFDYYDYQLYDYKTLTTVRLCFITTMNFVCTEKVKRLCRIGYRLSSVIVYDYTTINCLRLSAVKKAVRLYDYKSLTTIRRFYLRLWQGILILMLELK